MKPSEQFSGRWISLLLTVTYAIFCGLSFKFFHETICDALPNAVRSGGWILVIDLSYIGLSVLLVALLIWRLRQMIDRYENALAQSESRFRSLVESTSDWVWEMDLQCTYTFASPGVQALLGYLPEEVIGKTPFDFMVNAWGYEEGERLKGVLSRCQAASQVELHFTHRSGDTVIVEMDIMPIFDRAKNLCGYRGVDRDVTERRLAQDTLIKAHDFYRTLFENFPLPIWRADTDGRIIYCNRAGIGFSGRRHDDSTAWLGVIHPDDAQRVKESYIDAMQHQCAFTIYYRLRHIDGEYRNVVQVGQPCADHDGNHVGFIGYFHEVPGPSGRPMELYGNSQCADNLLYC